jgi:hypothetical protein
MRKVDESVWAERRRVVERWEGSGISMAEFCRREGIGYLAFASWRKRFAAPAAGDDGFAELVVERGTSRQAPDPAAAALVEIALPGGAVVRVFAGADAQAIRAAVQAVRPC